MAFYDSLRWVLAIFCMLVLVVEPRRAYSSSSRGAPAPPLVGMCASSVIIHGYKCQEFNVKTEDGYFLSMQRIPERRLGGGRKNKQPVLLQHGLLVDGLAWLMDSPDESLAFILADSGFDVWIANTRGSRFSRGHATLDPAKPPYWNWSWDELVAYDLPAEINFVYRQTGRKLDYVGHSLGTLVALTSFSQGKLVDKLRSAALLGPIAYMSHMTTTLAVLAAKAFLGETTELVGFAEFNPKGKAVARFLKTLCSNPNVNCYDLLTALTGKNCCLNASTVDQFFEDEPQPTSMKNLVHLSQNVRNGMVSKYDYGNADLNKKHYGQAKPPIYNLTNIPKNLPLFISYGGKDALSDDRDVELLLDSLKLHDGDKITIQFVKDFAHADFVMGVSAKDIVYNAIVAFLKRQ